MQALVQNIVNAASLGSLYALIALGIGLIFGIMQLVNLAYGELIMLAGYTVLILGSAAWPIVVTVTVVMTAIFALLMERAAFRPVRGADPTTLMVTSFAVSYLLQNLATVIEGSQSRAVAFGGSLIEPVTLFHVSIPKINIITLVVCLLLLGFLALFLKRTKLGIQMRAAAEDLQMARLLGVRVNAVIAAAFVISGVLAATTAVLLVGQTGTVDPTMGVTPLIVGVVAAVIGGLGRLAGAALGGFVLGCLTVGLQAALPASVGGYRDAFVYTFVIGILVVRPQGFLPGRAPRRI